MGGSQVLVLNASYEPVHVVSWKRAIQLLFQGKVEVLEESSREIRTVRVTIRVPMVMRLLQYIPLGKRRNLVRFSRGNVFVRDEFRCQYCGDHFTRNQLTLDHVLPVVQGGKKTWENIVSSCRSCNQKKGGRTPKEAGMHLIRKPAEPRWLPKTHLPYGFTVLPESWKIYLSVGRTNLKVEILSDPRLAPEERKKKSR